MNIDHFFSIGKPHAIQGIPCEDYACSAQTEAGLLGALSDGCGGAHANTDIGARIMTHSFFQIAQKHENLNTPEFWTELLSQIAKNCTIGSINDYYASLLGIKATEKQIQLLIAGDGGYAITYKSGEVCIMWSEWAGNAPYYPLYDIIQGIRAQFEAPADTPQLLVKYLSGDASALNSDVYPYTLQQFLRDKVVTIEKDEMAEISSILLFSDGMQSFTETPIHSAIEQFSSFKNRTGQFLKRRSLRSLQFFAENNRHQQDDIAVVALNLEDHD